MLVENNSVEYNLSLSELSKIETISVRSMNLCLKVGINNLQKLIDYYLRNGTFLNVRNCGDRSNLEISSICKKYISKEEDEENISLNYDITLDELGKVEKLSKRSINVCEKAGLNSLVIIINYYKKYNSFKAIRNCGNKSDKELIELCKRHLSGAINYKNLTRNDSLQVYLQLNPFKRGLVNRHLHVILKKISVRGQNSLTNLLGGKYNANDYIEKLCDSTFDFYQIKNVGKKTVEELENTTRSISSFILSIVDIENSNLELEYTKLVLKSNFETFNINLNDNISWLFNSDGKVKLFSLLDKLIENDQIFKKNEKQIFYHIYSNRLDKSIDELAERLGIVKERIRQLKQRLEKEIASYFDFIVTLELIDSSIYELQNNDEIIIIETDFIDKINKNENVNFNKLFYSIIFELLLNGTYKLIGHDDTFLVKKKNSKNKKLENYYLIKDLLFKSFDFFKFLNDINNKLIDRIPESYSLLFEGYLLQFTISDSKINLGQIREVCEVILFNEFDIIVNHEGYITFERNSRKQLLEYVIDILEDLGKMTKIEDITIAMNEKFPDLQTNETSVRSTLQRDKDLFIYFGRTSTYGLRKWEKTHKDLKGGTIRNLTEEFLSIETVPKHIDEICDYVSKFRPTTYTRSIFDNLIADKSGKFKYFGKGFFGLTTIKYADHIKEEVRKTNTWEDFIKILEKFRKDNPTKWPSISAKDIQERRLYTFLYNARRKFYSNKLEEYKIIDLKKLDFHFEQVLQPERRLQWITISDKLFSFLSTNKRLPSAHSESKFERALYRFFYINRRLLENGKLNDEQAQCMKLIKI